MRVFGNGGRDGEVELWLNKGQVVLEEPHMAIAIDCIPPHCMPILWKNIPYRKYLNFG
jgi:hypothetical protein